MYFNKQSIFTILTLSHNHKPEIRRVYCPGEGHEGIAYLIHRSLKWGKKIIKLISLECVPINFKTITFLLQLLFQTLLRNSTHQTRLFLKYFILQKMRKLFSAVISITTVFCGDAMDGHFSLQQNC